MDKHDLIEFLKENLKLNVSTEYSGYENTKCKFMLLLRVNDDDALMDPIEWDCIDRRYKINEGWEVLSEESIIV